MTAAVDEPQRPDGYPPRRFMLSRLKVELAVLALLVATILSIRYHDVLLRKTFVITPESAAAYGIRAYADGPQGGNSSIAADPARPLSWSCDLRDGYQYFYCGYELVLDAEARGKGVDLSDYESLKLVVSYEGSADWVRFYVKNYDPRYSHPKVAESAKFNKVEFLNRPGVQHIDVRLSDFSVADWWLVNNEIPAELSKPQFENIVAIDFQPGTGAKPGRHSFHVESIRFEGALLSQAQWYLCLLAFWVAAITFVLVHRMVTLRRDYEAKQRLQAIESRQLQTAKAAAESASKAKSQFLANMSHELRTPLNAILGYAQLLERDTLTDRQAAAVRTIHQSGSHLLTLITDVLDLAKIEAGKLELAKGSMDLKSCLGSIADMISVRAQEKGLGFTFECPADMPRFVTGDEKRLRQVLINLLGNAVKFTSQGGVALRVETLDAGPERFRLRFEVTDSGPGIDAGKLALIFQPFEQAGDQAGREGGTGLGLSISRQIVDLMGSSIRVDSAPGKGSRFWFDLDLDLAQQAEPAPGRAGAGTITGYKGPRRKVLVVDDAPENRNLLVARLALLGFDAIEAQDGAQAVEAAEASRPDLILMDMRMPVMDGFEATRQLRGDPTFAKTPIIAISASATAEFEARCLEAGADSFLSKPVDDEELVQILVWHLKLEWTRCKPSLDAAVAGTVRAPDAMIGPPQEEIDMLLQLAMAGNMRAIRARADKILAMDARYRPFAETLKGLAQSYQSPAILRLIEQFSDSRQAA